MDKNKAFSDFISLVEKNMLIHSAWRYGQTIINTLHEHRRDLFSAINGTHRDCFYRDDFADNALSWIQDNWDIPETPDDFRALAESMKPCPFCGAPGSLFPWDQDECTNMFTAGCRTGKHELHYISVPKNCISLWNERKEG
jgi:hypothetical protein